MPPYIVLSLLVGGIYGTLFHLWRGKSIRDLIIYLLSGIIGFGFGQALADFLGFSFMMLGPVHIIEATIISWTTLFVIQWLKIK